MTSPKTCAVLVGSLRSASISRKTAVALQKLAPAGLTLNIVEIGDLPLYNQDLEGDAAPEAWVRFRQAIRESDAVLFVTPEYNRSVPAALKNALDIGSRPSGKGVWLGKPGAVVGLSPGVLGGMAAALHLRQVLACLNIHTLAHPEVYLSGADKFFDETGALTSDSARTFLSGFLETFARWIARTGG